MDEDTIRTDMQAIKKIIFKLLRGKGNDSKTEVARYYTPLIRDFLLAALSQIALRLLYINRTLSPFINPILTLLKAYLPIISCEGEPPSFRSVYLNLFAKILYYYSPLCPPRAAL